MHRGEPTDINESTRIEWFTPAEIRDMLKQSAISDGLSFGGLTYALAMEVIDDPERSGV